MNDAASCGKGKKVTRIRSRTPTVRAFLSAAVLAESGYLAAKSMLAENVPNLYSAGSELADMNRDALLWAWENPFKLTFGLMAVAMIKNYAIDSRAVKKISEAVGDGRYSDGDFDPLSIRAEGFVMGHMFRYARYIMAPCLATDMYTIYGGHENIGAFWASLDGVQKAAESFNYSGTMAATLVGIYSLSYLARYSVNGFRNLHALFSKNGSFVLEDAGKEREKETKNKNDETESAMARAVRNLGRLAKEMAVAMARAVRGLGRLAKELAKGCFRIVHRIFEKIRKGNEENPTLETGKPVPSSGASEADEKTE